MWSHVGSLYEIRVIDRNEAVDVSRESRCFLVAGGLLNLDFQNLADGHPCSSDAIAHGQLR